MRIGFSGTRNGMTEAQKMAFINAGMGPASQFHHGACKGADTDAVLLVRTMFPDAWIEAHPGRGAKDTGPERPDRDEESIRMSNRVRREKSHFARNRDIVDETDLLIACPPRKPLPSSGGTAYTISYARKVGKPVIVIYPDGTVEDSRR